MGFEMIDCGIIQGLARNRIIYQSASLGDMVEGFAYNINDLAWDFIQKKPNVLDGTTNTFRTDKADYRW